MTRLIIELVDPCRIATKDALDSLLLGSEGDEIFPEHGVPLARNTWVEKLDGRSGSSDQVGFG